MCCLRTSVNYGAAQIVHSDLHASVRLPLTLDTCPLAYMCCLHAFATLCTRLTYMVMPKPHLGSPLHQLSTRPLGTHVLPTHQYQLVCHTEQSE